MQTIKAAVCREFGQPLSVEDVQLRDPGPGEILVSLKACAVCFSDISYMDGGWGGTLPAVYGHEAAGHIEAVGPDIHNHKVGDSVIVTLVRACGTCVSCTTGQPVLCLTPANPEGVIEGASGETVQRVMAVGGFAEKVVVHHSQVVEIPQEMPMESACLLSCGVVTGVGAAVNTAQVRPGQTVVVIGAGGVGLNAIQGAHIAGASRIIAVDLTEEKLEIAMAFGATDGVLASGPSPWKEVFGITGRGADAVLVTVGAIPAYDTAARYLAPGGKVVMVGMPHTGDQSSYEPGIFAALGQGMVGTKMGDVVLNRDIPWMIDLYQQGRLKLDELVSGLWSLEEINEAITDTRSGAAKRNVIVFDR